MATGEGWHSDPFGRFAQRYHNGTDWTEHVSDGSGTSMVDPSGTSSHIEGGVPGPPPGYGEHGHVGGTVETASPWMRLLARIIDAVVVGIPVAVVVFVLFGAPIDFEDEEAVWEFNIAASLATSALLALYETAFIGRWGRTLGKMATGMTVVRRSGWGLPGYGVAAIRAIAFVVLYSLPYPGVLGFVSFVLFIVTVVMIFADSLRQTLHDKIASTVVVKSSSLGG